MLLQLGDVPPAKISVKKNAFAAFCAAEAGKIRAILNLSRLQTKALKDSQGDHAIADNLPSIWSTFGERPDVDSAKLYAQHIHRFNVTAISKNYGLIEEELEKHVNWCSGIAEMLTENEVEDSRE